MGAEHGTFWDSDVNDARRYWEARFTAARRFMQERRDQDSVLIEVAAQHPLIGGSQPNEEFIARLDRGKELFDRFRPDVERIEIYVPGSRHVFEGAADEISLSDAGKNYLREIVVPTELIRGEDLNQAYKGEVGVYNSADECFAASYFKDHDFGRLFSVVSPAQLLRKILHYVEFGVLPLSHTAPTEAMFNGSSSTVA